MRLRIFASPLFVALAGLTACGGATSATPAGGGAGTTAAAVDAAAATARAGANDTGLGHLDFPVTGTAECQRSFTDGMLALHSFLYDQAHVSFGKALAADPACAMAAWGDAMAYDKAIWDEREAAKGRASLARVTDEKALTAKERSFLAVARASFAKDLTKDAHAAWLPAAEAMHRAYPDDDEVTLQYVLALLSNYVEDDAHVREQMEAGALALEVLQHNPENPGAAHYVIHAFDSPDHAILALPAARRYAQIAPAGSHALHMPSHVFSQLGMWRDVVSSNERAYAASVAWQTSRQHTPSAYDWHSYSWLVAARLELGQRIAAKKLLDAAAALLLAAKDDSSELRDDYLSMVTAYATQTGRWSEVDARIAPVFARAYDEGPPGGGQVACAMHAPGGKGAARLPSVLFARLDADLFRAEAAVHRRDESAAKKWVAEAKAQEAQFAPWKTVLAEGWAKGWEARGDTLLVRAGAAARPSPAAQKNAADALETYLKDHGDGNASGPAMEQPSRELLGEARLAAGQPKEALVQFDKVLHARPKRALSLLGAARAAKAAGDADTARARYRELAELWKDADPDVPELGEVKAGAGG